MAKIKKNSKFQKAIDENLKRKGSEKERIMKDDYYDDMKDMKESIIDRQIENQDVEALERAAKKKKMKLDILRKYGKK
jgi:hypothetical protein